LDSIVQLEQFVVDQPKESKLILVQTTLLHLVVLPIEIFVS